VVVLSNNDGCIVARSNEAKALKIDMGLPYFKIKDVLVKHDVAVLSSNYALYGDMSSRVMSILSEYSDKIEIYSIDEAFLEMGDNWTGKELYELGLEIKAKVRRETGIPVSVGIAPTKTLAKVANELVKKDNKRELKVDNSGNKQKGNYGGCLVLGHSRSGEHMDEFLAQLAIGDVWGVGRRYANKLQAFGLQTAKDLKHCNLDWIQSQTNTLGKHMVMELGGTVCFQLEQNPPDKKSIVSSRSFGEPITKFADLEQAVALHATKLGEKLRKQQGLATSISIFILNNRFQKQNYYFGMDSKALTNPTNYTPELIKTSLKLLKQIYKPGISYKKCGVVATSIVTTEQDQSEMDLFALANQEKHKKTRIKKDNLMLAFDKLNSRYGQGTVKIAKVGSNHKWAMKATHRSSRYTTLWSELLRVG
jgi:DNA polymerase V